MTAPRHIPRSRRLGEDQGQKQGQQPVTIEDLADPADQIFFARVEALCAQVMRKSP